MKSFILSLLLLQVNCEKATENDIPVGQMSQETDEELNKHLDSYGYDPRVLGMGSAKDAWNDYGAILNEYN